MVPLRPAIALVLSSALLGLGCVGPTREGRMYPESSHTVQDELGYADVIRIGQDYAVSSGYEVTEVAEAVQVRPNYWRVRFGLAPRGSGKLLDIEFDEARRQVVGTTEVEGSTGGGGTPTP